MWFLVILLTVLVVRGVAHGDRYDEGGFEDPSEGDE